METSDKKERERQLKKLLRDHPEFIAIKKHFFREGWERASRYYLTQVRHNGIPSRIP